MEDIDGGLHPAVDGQSLDEDEDEVVVVKGACNYQSCVVKTFPQISHYIFFMQGYQNSWPESHTIACAYEDGW